MRIVVIIAFCTIVMGFTAAGAGDFPEHLTYHIYVFGEYAGKSDIEITEKEGLLLIESECEMDYGEFQMALSCRTEIDRETFAPRYFSYEGHKVGLEISGTVWVEGDSIHADIVEDGNHFPSSKSFDGDLVFFQNYIVEHQMVMYNYIARSPEPYVRYTILFPSDFVAAATVGALESEVELPTIGDPTVCRKYAISMKNSAPYYGYFDPERRVPVYSDFPSANTEIFLLSAYGEKPATKYTRPQE